MTNEDIALFHNHNEIDKNAITVCLDVKLLHDEHVDEEIVKLWNSLKHRPKLIIFDLDLTLWPFWIDTHVSPPFTRQTNDNNEHTIVDQVNKKLTYYKDVPKILNTLRNHCLKDDGHLAIASRTSEDVHATQLIELFGWRDHFSSLQMYSGTKVRHINKICDELSIADKSHVLFFDDDRRNIRDTESLGLTGYHLNIKNGMTRDACLNGLKMHDEKLKNM